MSSVLATTGVDERPIIVTKVRPPRRRRDLVSRSRLVDYLAANADRKLLLVSAPPGYGKTTLLVDFLHETGLPACWYRLDDSDTDLPIFFEHLVASLRQRYPGVAERTLGMIRTQPRSDPESVIGSLINEIAEEIPEFFLIVLDDYHKLDRAPLINAAVDFLLKYLPDNCRVVVCSRTLPKQLTLTRLAAEGQVVGVGQEHLRFRPDEILDLVHHLHGETLSEEEAKDLAARSEGWIAALVMGSGRLLDGVRTGLDVPVADRGQLFRFLAEEVLDTQREDVRRFLLDTAILDALSPELCDYVRETTDSGERLSELEEMNLFLLPLEGDDQWYRYHQLFHEFLLARAREAGDGAEADRHRRAAAWYAQRGQVDPEINHLLGAGEFAAAADRMQHVVGRNHDHGRWHTIVRWVNALPEDLRAERPALLRAVGVAYAYLGNMAESIAALGRAIRQYEETADADNLAAALVSRSYTWRYMGHVDASLADATKALSLSVDPESRVASSAHRSLGACYSLKGDMRSGADELLRALAGFEAQGDTPSVALTHSDLSAMYQIGGDLERALVHAGEARRTWERLGSLGNLALALNNMGTAYHAQGRFKTALDLLDDAATIAQRAGDRRTEALALIGKADVEADLGRFPAAIANYESGLSLARGVGQGALVAYALACQAEAERLSGNLPAAQELIAQAREEPSTHRSAYESALVHYVQGTVYLDRGDYEEAGAHLEEAVRSYGVIGALREMARTELALAATSHRSGDAAGAERWWRRALGTVDKFGHRDAFAPQVARLPDVFARDRIRPADSGQSPLFSTEPLDVEDDVADTDPPPDDELTAASRSAADGEILLPEDGADDREEPTGGHLAVTRVRTVRPAATDQRRTKPKRAAPTLRVRAFGGADVESDGHLVDIKEWESTLARDLLFYLLDRPNGAARTELLLTFWPDSSQAKAASSFHSTLHRLRRIVGKEAIRTEGGRYKVSPDFDLDYDVRTFEGLVDEARSTSDATAATRALEAAMDLVQGDYMAGTRHDWVSARADALNQAAIAAGLRLAALRRAAGDHASSAEAYRRVSELDPLREDIHREILRSYVHAGERNRALKHYDRLVELLHRELGVTPDAETDALVERIRAKDELPSP